MATIYRLPFSFLIIFLSTYVEIRIVPFLCQSSQDPSKFFIIEESGTGPVTARVTKEF